MTFDRIFREHRAGVTRWLSRRCDHRVELEDAVQETFLQAWRSRGQRRTENVRAWLLGIASRVYWKMRRRCPPSAIEWTVNGDGRVSLPAQEHVVELDQVRALIARLGPAQAVALRGLADGFTATEVAEQRGASLASTTMAISLGRLRLREKTERVWYG